MDINALKKDLIRHEGCKYVVYRDSLGYATAGIGHLLRANEQKPVGTAVTQAQVDAWFSEDVQAAIGTAKRIVGEQAFSTLPETVQRVLCNLSFNLGNRLSGFSRFLTAIRAHDYSAAAVQLENSLWYSQVGNRAKELCAALRTGHF